MDRELDKFRTLLFLSGVSLVIAFAVSSLPMPLSEAQVDVLLQGGVGALAAPEISEILWWSWLALYAGAHVLAFFYSWWSKPLFLLTLPLTIASSVVNGVTTHGPWDNAVWALHGAIFPFAIGMLFFSPRVQVRLRADWRASWSGEPYRSPVATPVVPPPDYS